MKLTYSQLETHLTKKLAPVYLISGDEWLLKQDASKLIRQASKQAGYREHLPITLENDQDLYTQLYCGSFFAENRLLELDCRSTLPNNQASKILTEYAKNPMMNNVLLINLNKIDNKISKSAWYLALEKIGIAVAIWPIAREQLPGWIIQRAKKYRLSLTRAAADLLADGVEGNLAAAAQALEKLYLLQPSAPIDSDTVKLILTDESQFTVFDFTEQLIAGDLPRALHMLEKLKIAGIEPILILWSIAREIRLLANFALQLKHGSSYEHLFQQQRLFSRRQTGIKRFLQQFSAEDCWQYLADLANIDLIVKGVLPGNPWAALQLFCLRMVN